MNLADVNVPAKFTEETANFAGDKTISGRKFTNQTALRQRAERTILKTAQDKGVSVEQVVKTILTHKGSLNQLNKYVQSKGETPLKSPLLLAAQAALLRADEIATISRALDVQDTDSLNQIETAEQDAIDNSNPEANTFFSPDVAAAIKLTIDHIKGVDVATNGDGQLKNFISRAKRLNKADGFDLNTAHLLNGFDITYIDPNEGLKNLQSQETTSGGGFFSIFDKIVNGINSVSTGIKGAATTIQNAIGNTKNSISSLLQQTSDTTSDIGAQSIQKAIGAYIPYIIAGIIAFTLIIVIAIYASKRK